MTYKTSLDKLAILVTTIYTILLAAIIIGHIFLMKEEGKVLSILVAVLFSLIYFGTFIFRPINYRLTSDKVIIRRPLTDIEIDRQGIKSVEQIDKDKLIAHSV